VNFLQTASRAATHLAQLLFDLEAEAPSSCSERGGVVGAGNLTEGRTSKSRVGQRKPRMVEDVRAFGARNENAHAVFDGDGFLQRRIPVARAGAGPAQSARLGLVAEFELVHAVKALGLMNPFTGCTGCPSPSADAGIDVGPLHRRAISRFWLFCVMFSGKPFFVVGDRAQLPSATASFNHPA